MSFPIDNKFRILKTEHLEADNIDLGINGILLVDNIINKTNNGDVNVFTQGSGNVKISNTKYPKTLGSSGQILKNNGSSELVWSSDYVDINSSQTLTNKNINFANNILTDVVSTNTFQTITEDKHTTKKITTDISTGYLGVRDSNVNSFLHTISYDSPSASIFLCSSETNITNTGFLVGYKTNNIKTNSTVNKFKVGYLASNNTTFIDIEDVNFHTMQNNKHTLTNINSINLNGGSSKTCTLIIDNNQLTQNNVVYMPLNTNVELKYLEGMSGQNIQPQINNKIDTSSNSIVTGTITFEKAQNNSNNFIINNTIGNTNGFSITNAFSANTLRILKDSDDLSIVLSNIQRAKLSGNDFDLTNGGSYKANGVSIKDIGETLTNKIIDFSSNILSNVMSTSTDQVTTAKKTFTNLEPIILNNSTSSKISYQGTTNYSQRMDTSGFNFYNDTSSVSMMTINNINGVNITASGKLKVDGELVHYKRTYSSSAPTVNNDDTQGYSIGSKWFNSTNKSKYECVTTTTGAAYWKNLNFKSLSFNEANITTLTYTQVISIMSGYDYYNKMHIISYGDGIHKVQLYNVSTATQIVETADISAGGPILTTINIPSSPVLYTWPITIKVSAKIITGTTCTIYCISFE